ncbi:MAG: hypothetical protein JW733_08120, partial [Coriobacteriia bacterium]|nr:hypothetical protein [Coriobacteriia bacterium]
MMDCLHAAETLSASYDREPVEPEELAEAHEHCGSCAECASLLDTVSRLDAIPTPRASAELVAVLVARSAATAAEIRSAASAPENAGQTGAHPDLVRTPDTDSLSAPQSPTHAVRRWLPSATWTPRFAAFAAAAAVLIVALSVGAVGLLGSLGGQTAADDSIVLMESTGERAAESGPTDGDVAAVAPPKSEEWSSADEQRAAPPYVVLTGAVWALQGPATPEKSLLTTAGVVATSLDGTGDVTERTAFLDTPESGRLWIATDDGGWLAFARVVRELGRRPFGLVTESAIGRFGEWPSLPTRFEQPTSPDGSPTFRYYGFDDKGVDVFVPLTGRAEDGFAVAPGTAPDDP